MFACPVKNQASWKGERTMLSVLYMSDLHLESQLGFTVRPHSDFKDKDKVLSEIKSRLSGIFKPYLHCDQLLILLAGDISANSLLSGLFITALNSEIQLQLGSKIQTRVLYALGNHELWQQDFIANDTGLCFGFSDVESAVSAYQTSCACSVLENSVVFLDKQLNILKYASDMDLANLSIEELTELDALSKYIIFGGIGYSGLNKQFNAVNYPRLYAGTINSLNEPEYSLRFDNLYKHIVHLRNSGYFCQKPCFCVTHMPVSDWHSGAVVSDICHISGHTHDNVLDTKQKIYSDNQIGYKYCKWQFKAINFGT